jgi:hypothetical protein
MVHPTWKDMTAHQKFKILNEWCASLSVALEAQQAVSHVFTNAFNRPKLKLRELSDGFVDKTERRDVAADVEILRLLACHNQRRLLSLRKLKFRLGVHPGRDNRPKRGYQSRRAFSLVLLLRRHHTF